MSEAAAKGVFVFAVFLIPALLAPGPFEPANIAGVAFALWMARDAARRSGRVDIGATFPYRVAPVGPAVLFSAAAIFLTGAATLWAGSAPSDRLASIYEAIRVGWSFPFSPVLMFAAASSELPSASEGAVRLVALTLTVAVVLGAVFALISLVGRVGDRTGLRRHALIWKGIRVEDAAERLAKRGAKGLKPLRDPLADVANAPVSGRLFLRAASLLIALATLPYAPVFLRMLAGSRIPQVEAFLDSNLAKNAFFQLWFTGLWAIFIAAAMIFIAAYLRLGLALARR